VKSNMSKGSPSASPRKVAMMILGGVPIRVARPPMREQGARRVDDLAGQVLDHAGIRKAAADHQDQRNDDGRRMAESGEGLIGRHDTCNQRRHQGREGHQVVAPAPPDQQREQQQEDGEEENLRRGRHRR
jgi:hypothetical protein